MSIIMNESIGAMEYDGLINSAYPADVIHASLASGYGKLKRGTLIARASNGSLIPWGSDITDDLVEVLTVSNHQATKAQAGLRTALLKVFALDFITETLAVEDHEASITVAGLNKDTLVVKYGEDTLSLTTDYTVSYEDGVLTITLVDSSEHYEAEELEIKCFFAETFVPIEKTTDYTAAYESNTLTITLVEDSDYYDSAKLKIVCPYVYNEGTIAAANLILAEDIDTGETPGSTVIARVYRTGIFNRKAILHDPKAVDGINDVTKEKLRSVGIYLNDSISI